MRDAPADAQRLDQWLWFARITKSRTLAQSLIERGKVRLNRTKVDKMSALVKPGDVLTVTLGPKVRTFEVVGIGLRRGPASEAQKLLRDLTPMAQRPAMEGVGGDRVPLAKPPAEGSGRPGKRDRRLILRLKKGHSSL